MTSSRRYVTSLPTSRLIRLVRLLLAVGIGNCKFVLHMTARNWVGHRVTGSHLGDPVPMLVVMVCFKLVFVCCQLPVCHFSFCFSQF